MIELKVFGEAQSQGSKNAFVVKGRAVVTETGGAKHKNWRAAVAAEAQRYQSEHNIAPLDGPLKVSLDFVFTKPKSKPKWKVYADVKPDLDKTVRSVLDSLSKILIVDDARVCCLIATKRYAVEEAAHVLIRIEKLEESR
jgi:Holliday junction resolvase RusA-like endonuclease